jgi:hypothetical protein
MLQLAVWGICAMLVVKGLDVLHRDAIADHDDKEAPGYAKAAAFIAFVSALLLAYLSIQQASEIPTPATFPSY